VGDNKGVKSTREKKTETHEPQKGAIKEKDTCKVKEEDVYYSGTKTCITKRGPGDYLDEKKRSLRKRNATQL